MRVCFILHEFSCLRTKFKCALFWLACKLINDYICSNKCHFFKEINKELKHCLSAKLSVIYSICRISGVNFNQAYMSLHFSCLKKLVESLSLSEEKHTTFCFIRSVM